MSLFFKLLGSVWKYKIHTFWGIVFHVLTAVFTVLSIPLVIPFFQILFGISPSDYSPPESWWHLEDTLNYGFSRLIAMSDHFIALQVVCVLVVIIFLFKNLFRFLVSYFMVYVRNALLRDLRSEIWDGYESMSLLTRHKFKKGYLTSLITNDLSEVDNGILKAFELIFKTPLVIIGSLLFMIWLSPNLTLIAFGLILFTLIIIGKISHTLKRQAGKAQESLSAINVLVDHYLSAIKLIRTHHTEGFFKKEFEDKNEAYFGLSNKILRKRDLASPLAEFLGVVTIVVLLFYGTHSVFQGAMQPSTFFAFIFAFYNVIDPAKSFSREYANVQKGLAALERIEKYTSGIPVLNASDIGERVNTFNESLTIKNLNFRFQDTNSDLLKNLNFSLKKGDRLGIVGESGAGKTTLIDLILKFYDPSEGQILLDNRDIQALDSHSYRSLFGLVTQHPVLFHGTVEENIVLDRPMDREVLKRAMDLCGLDNSFRQRHIGDDISMISGGEAQRVSLARTLYRNPEIILMDEPTSHLDIRSRVTLSENISVISQNFTIVIISHQPDLLRDMDRILYLVDGQIEDQGQYDDLFSRNELFRKLMNA